VGDFNKNIRKIEMWCGRIFGHKKEDTGQIVRILYPLGVRELN